MNNEVGKLSFRENKNSTHYTARNTLIYSHVKRPVGKDIAA